MNKWRIVEETLNNGEIRYYSERRVFLVFWYRPFSFEKFVYPRNIMIINSHINKGEAREWIWDLIKEEKRISSDHYARQVSRKKVVG